MSTAENKAFIARYFNALSGKPKPAETVAEYASEEAMKQHVAFFEAAFPHYELFADDMIAEGDKVCVCARFRGTHNGDLMGIAPTGKTVTLPFIIVYQITDGKIAGHTMAIDQMDLMKQLGVMS
jgi:predicted ester cyclase